MDIEKIRRERSGWLKWKNIAPILSTLDSLPSCDESRVEFGDSIKIFLPKEYEDLYGESILKIAKSMMPWRKGPFEVGSLFIDSEWRSYIKYNLLLPHFKLKEKVVGDVGCNNGYYLFKMLSQEPKELIGFDPSPLYYLQFKFIDHFINSKIVYELLGVEHLEFYEKRFDILFCLGVLYHRSDPVSTLKSLYRSLKSGGELILDTFMIDIEGEYALVPKGRYSKIPNIYFIPTVDALKNWCYRAGFRAINVLAIKKTDVNEQRKTDWIATESLENFLDSSNSNRTVEGYPAPVRVYIKATK